MMMMMVMTMIINERCSRVFSFVDVHVYVYVYVVVVRASGEEPFLFQG